MKRSSKFPKQMFIAKEGTDKRVFFLAEIEPAKLFGFIDKTGNLEIATYELVSVKQLKLIMI